MNTPLGGIGTGLVAGLFVFGWPGSSTAQSTVETLLDSAEVYHLNGEHDRAVKALAKVVKLAPQLIEAHRRYQDVRLERGDTARASVREAYRARAFADSTDPLNWYLLGRCVPCTKGVGYFERALKIDECCTWALVGRGACRFEQGEIEQAKRDFLVSIKCDRDFDEAYHNLALAYLAKEETRRARRVYRRLLSLDRSNPRAYQWLGDMYLENEDFQHAELAYARSIHNGGTDPYLYFKLGYACFKQGKLAKAEKYYRQGVEMGNHTYEIYHNLGTVQELLDKPELALENYKRAFAKSRNYRLRYSMGNCAVLLGLYREAAGNYRAFLDKEPENVEALVGLANAHQMKRDYDRAIEIYKQILAIDDRFAKAYYNLGSIYAYHLADPRKMREYWTKFIELFPDHRDAPFVRNEMEKLTGEL